MKASYIHPQNKTKYPYYLVTQLGCDLIRNRLKGVRGTQFAVLYINEFHRLRNEAEAIPAPQEAPQIEQESLFDNVPQTPEERDLAYLLNKVTDARNSQNIGELAGKLFKILKLIQVIEDDK